MQCDVLSMSHLLGKRWAVPLIEELALKKIYGFNSFVRKSGKITPTGLSRQLKELENAGIVKKIARHSKNKTATTFVLTRKGREMHEIIMELKKWNLKWNLKWNAVSDYCLHTPCTECPKYAQ